MPSPIPPGLTSLTPQLMMDGASEAIAFYVKAFGGKEVMRAEGPGGKVMHGVVQIGNAQVFVNDTFPEMGAGPTASVLWIYCDDVDALFKRAVDAGVTVKMPLADMFWGDRIAQVMDKWGNKWNLATHVKDLSPEEMQKAQDEAMADMGKTH
ncbi:MAG: VOC family protein [Deltaproteobacteria bacterium]|nr:VOC family protein [Deltaproteobacteria bacterium]